MQVLDMNVVSEDYYSAYKRVAEHGYFEANFIFREFHSLDMTHCYWIYVLDSYGDGLSTGSYYEVYWRGTTRSIPRMII